MSEIPIQIPKATITRVGLSLPESLEITEWAQIGKALCMAQESLAWCVGDWINFGEKNYGEKYKEALKFFGKEVLGAMGYEERTLREYAYVSRSVEMSIRIDNLSFAHHQVVAPLNEAQKEYWLKEAKANEWTVSELRSRIREKLGQYQEPEKKIAFNTLAWSDDGLRYFKRELDAKPISEWPNDRLQLVTKDLEPLASIYSLFRGEIEKRGLLNAAN